MGCIFIFVMWGPYLLMWTYVSVVCSAGCSCLLFSRGPYLPAEQDFDCDC